MLKMKLELLSDEALVKMIQENSNDKGSFEELVYRYRRFINFKCRSYYIAGADKEDVFQEGLIGLYQAAMSYDEEKPASFNTFAVLCITRQIQTAVKMASRKKHTPLNGYISLWENDAETDQLREKYGLIPQSREPGPEEICMKKELSERVSYVVENLLSDKEKDLYTDFIRGYSYKQISKKHNTDLKSIDNAIQRARKKIEVYTKNY